MNDTGLEWARVTPEIVVVANSDCAWTHHPNSFGSFDPFTVPMEGEGSRGTTRNLLDGALCAA